MKSASGIFWTTREGQQVRLSEMTDKHLRNAAAYLRRRADDEFNAYWQVGCMLRGEQAQYDWENHESGVTDARMAAHAVADAMDGELARRMKGKSRPWALTNG